jgi:hypothetical protein
LALAQRFNRNAGEPGQGAAKLRIAGGCAAA